MKQTKTSCRNAIIRWYAGAPCGTGVSLEVFQEHYGGSQTKEDLNGITKTQVNTIFEHMWDGVDGDNLAAGLDLFLTAVAMHADVKEAVGMLQDVCGIPQTGIMTTKLPAIALVKEKVPVLDGLIRECAKRNVPVFSGIKEQAYKMMGAGYKLTDPCCGNCAWSGGETKWKSHYGMDVQEDAVVCAYNPVTCIRPKHSKCHHHAFTTGWNEPDRVQLRFVEETTYGAHPVPGEVALPYDKLRDDLAATRERLVAVTEELKTAKQNMTALGAKLVELRKAQADK